MKLRDAVTRGITLVLALGLLAVLGVTLVGPGNIGPVTGKTCTVMGCVDNTLLVTLAGDIPERYTLKVTSAWGRTATIDCPGDYNLYIDNRECKEYGALFTYTPFSPPKKATISVLWEDNVKSETLKPIYSTVRPNGPDCEPECLKGQVTIELP